MKVTGPKEGEQQINFSLKEGFSRVDVSAKGMSAGVIMDQAKQEIIILMAEQKMYMVQPMRKAADAPAADQNPGEVTVEKTSATEKILGYDCVKYVAKDKTTTTEMWVTDQLGTFMGMAPGGGGPMGGRRQSGPGGEAWEQALRGKDAFPLRVASSKGGKETFRMEATDVQKQHLDASVFAPPEGFQKFDLGIMMKGMMPGGMPPRGRPPSGG